MRNILIFLVLALGVGIGVACVEFPAGCAKLRTDAGRDVAAVAHQTGVAWSGPTHAWSSVLTPIGSLFHDAAHDLNHIASPDAMPPATARQGAVAVEPAAGNPPTVGGQPEAADPVAPAWKAPAVFPAKRNWTWTTVTGEVYRNVKVIGMEPNAVTIIYDGGGRRLTVADLGASLQAELGYDSSLFAAATASRQQAAAQQAASGGIPGMLSGWVTDDYATGVTQARLRGKKVLLFFTGSTWCPMCIQFEKDIFPTAEFQNFGASNYVMVKLEVAHQSPSGDPTLDKNQELANKYGVHGVPTLIAIELDGTEITRMEGCPPSASDVINRFSNASASSN